MSLRLSNLDHSDGARDRDGRPEDGLIRLTPETGNPLQFWTGAKENILVDLTQFADGQALPRRGSVVDWVPFSGRPGLIHQLAPALQDELAGAGKTEVSTCITQLRRWWRLLDAQEAALLANGLAFSRLESVSELSDVHQALAMAAGFNRQAIGVFLRVANTTLSALGLRRLYWKLPADSTAEFDLPSDRDSNYVRHTLRQKWYQTCDRWAYAMQLLITGVPRWTGEGPERTRRSAAAIKADEKLLAQYRWYEEAQVLTGNMCPTRDELLDQSRSSSPIPKCWIQTTILQAGFYANGSDIRIAFHHCLGQLGWNVATLLTLDATLPIVTPHPTDPSRWFMEGQKDRGDSDHPAQGMYKSRGSAGVVILELLERSKPLRQIVHQQLAAAQARRAELDNLSSKEQSKLLKEIAHLQLCAQSVWLYVSRSDGITCLTSISVNSGTKESTSFLGELFDELNDRLTVARGKHAARLEDRKRRDDEAAKHFAYVPAAALHDAHVLVRHMTLERRVEAQLQPVQYFSAKNFRNIYGRFHFAANGRSVMVVQAALNQQRIATATGYVLDRHEKAVSRDKLSACLDAIFDVGIRSGEDVDHAAVVITTEDGKTTPIQLYRLDEYRELKRSRLGVGCKNPKAPSRKVDPAFKKGGKRSCSVQRCMLCLENAVVLPESLDGLCMRVAEIDYLRGQMSFEAYSISTFPEELKNTLAALTNFEASAVNASTETWKRRIADGTHIVPVFDGRSLEAA